MATQVITRTLCDYCEHDDGVETPESTRLVVSLNGDEYEVDVCERHAKPLADLKASLDEVARKVPRRGRKPASGTDTDPNHGGNLCPACGQVLSTRGSLTAHTRQVHGKTLAELEGKPLPFECPECGKRFATTTGIGVHKRVHVSK